MRRAFKPAGRWYERGVAAIEAAIILPILLLFIGLPSVLWAFYFREYTAVQKALHDAALYLSTAPRVEMTTSGPDGAPAALTVAKTIMAKEMAGILPSGISPGSDFICLYRVGGNPAMRSCTVENNQDPTQTLIQIGVTIRVKYLNPLTGNETGVSIAPYAPVAYVGN